MKKDVRHSIFSCLPRWAFCWSLLCWTVAYVIFNGCLVNPLWLSSSGWSWRFSCIKTNYDYCDYLLNEQLLKTVSLKVESCVKVAVEASFPTTCHSLGWCTCTSCQWQTLDFLLMSRQRLVALIHSCLYSFSLVIIYSGNEEISRSFLMLLAGET